MNRISVKTCRRFPELEPLSDADCEILVEWLFERQPSQAYHSWLARAGAAGVTLVGWTALVLCVAGWWLDSLYRNEAAGWPLPARAGLLALLLAPGGIAAAKAMDAARGSVIAGLIAEALVRPRAALDWCAECGYALDGLPRDGGVILCPECGREVETRPRSLIEQVIRDGTLDLSRVSP